MMPSLLRTALTFAHDHPATRGHFPGNPIIPGAALLDETLAALEAAHGALGRCAALQSAKFLLPVRPGDRMEIVAQATSDGAISIGGSVGQQTALVCVARYDGATADAAPDLSGTAVASPPAPTVQQDIGELLPHTAPMILLGRLARWDDDRLRCLAISHRDPGNPLARHARLSSVCAIEYAAQAMAVHGALSQNASIKPKGALLAAVREVVLRVPQLHDVAGDLLIDVERLAGDSAGVVYRFWVSADGMLLVEGRATVMLDLNIEVRREQ